jgi:glycerol-3-phosphate dehydrogenase
VTRDYVFDLDETAGAPLLNIFGGKITTFRELAERGMHEIRHIFPDMGKDWTETAPLPGGDMPNADYSAFRETLKAEYPWMTRALREYYGRRYGTLTRNIVGSATSLNGLGRYFGAHLYEAEVRWLVKNEWALTAEDIIWRRTKHRLDMTPDEIAAFGDWFEATRAEAS